MTIYHKTPLVVGILLLIPAAYYIYVGEVGVLFGLVFGSIGVGFIAAGFTKTD